MGMVASGMGVALIPSLALVSAREDIAIRPAARRPPGAPGPGRRRRRSPQRAGRCAAGRPAPGRARAPVGRAAAGRSPPPDAQAASGSSSSTRSSTTAGSAGAAGRTARDCTRSSVDDGGGVLERVGDHARRCRSTWRPAAGRRPRRRTARRWGCGASPAPRGARATGSRSARRGGWSPGRRRRGAGGSSRGRGRRLSSTRDRERCAEEVVVEHGSILRCDGPSHIGRMVPVRGRLGLTWRRATPYAENRLFAG